MSASRRSISSRLAWSMGLARLDASAKASQTQGHGWLPVGAGCALM